MVKDSVNNASSREAPSSIKKRRKNTSGNDDAEGDLYKKFISFEEKEAANRKTNSDVDLYYHTCENIKTLLDTILELKTNKPADVSGKVSEKMLQAAAHVVVLKKLNRLEKVRITAAREALMLEKQKVDSTNFQYQNLMYEAAHLLSEFKKCKQFKSKDEDIELVSVEEFLKEAPVEKTKPFKDVSSLNDVQKHELHLARLEWELTQRKKLAELCNTLENEKKQVAAEIVKSKNRLSGLAPKLTAVLESTKPLQDYLGLPIEKTYAEHKLASLLPNPLYLFYANTDAYKKVYDIDLSLEICGDQDEAVQWKRLQSTQMFDLEESDTEIEQQEIEENLENKKRRRHKSFQVDKQEEKKKRILETHPLNILCTIKVRDSPTLKIRFNYCTALNLVTVNSDVDHPDSAAAISAMDVLSGESILGELFPSDYGTESPNRSNAYQLKKIGINSYNQLTSKLGYCYLWAQRVCGLDFLLSQDNKSATNLSCTNIEIVMKTIYKRLKSRTSLASQLQQLEQNLVPTIPDKMDAPLNSVSALTKWSSITWQDYCTAPCTTELIASEIVSCSDIFCCATIVRPTKPVTLVALIAIKNNYPAESPIFSLTIKSNEDLHSGNCDEIRDMERAVNVGWNNSSTAESWLLSAQLLHLCAYFDVYLETLAPSSYPQKSVFFKSMCGRNRRRPFKFRKVGAGIFTQF